MNLQPCLIDREHALDAYQHGVFCRGSPSMLTLYVDWSDASKTISLLLGSHGSQYDTM
jgi:hypothetical protein